MRFFIVFSMLLAGIVGNAHAQGVKGVQCEGCSQHDMNLTARDRSTYLGEETYVFSLSTGVVRKFVIRGSNSPGADFLAREVRVEPEISSYFSDLSGVYSQNGGSLTFILDVETGLLLDGSAENDVARIGAAGIFEKTGNSNIPPSAYDYLNSSASQNAVEQYAQRSIPAISTAFWGFANIINPLKWINSSAATINLKMVFSDGSHVTVRFNNVSNRFDYVNNSATDSQGNRIPQTAQDFAGEFGYSEYVFHPGGQGDYVNFLNRAYMLGIPVEGRSGDGARTRIGCSTVNDTSVCVIMAY